MGFAEKSSSTFRLVSSICAKGVEPAAVTTVLNESPEKAACSWRRPWMEFVLEEFVDEEFVAHNAIVLQGAPSQEHSSTVWRRRIRAYVSSTVYCWHVVA